VRTSGLRSELIFLSCALWPPLLTTCVAQSLKTIPATLLHTSRQGTVAKTMGLPAAISVLVRLGFAMASVFFLICLGFPVCLL